MDTKFKKGMIPWNKKEPIRKVCPYCSKEFFVRPCELRVIHCSYSCKMKAKPPIRTGMKTNQETRGKLRLAKLGFRGEKHWNWRNGTARKERHTEMQRDEYKQWRLSVFIRDKFTCQICGKVGGYIEADHIKPWATHKELRYDLNNGRVLCKPCHKKTPTYGKKALIQVGG